MAGAKVMLTMTCIECGREFTRLVWMGSKPKYCTKACRTNAWGRMQFNRRQAERVAAGVFGRFGLECDPWKTGQLPESVTRNALWRAE